MTELDMKHVFLTLLFFGVLIAWLVLSYLPADTIFDQIALSHRFTPLFRILLLGSAVLFLALHSILVASVLKFPRRIRRRGPLGHPHLAEEITDDDIRIDRRMELVWTALPLVASLGLLWAGYQAIGGG